MGLKIVRQRPERPCLDLVREAYIDKKARQTSRKIRFFHYLTISLALSLSIADFGD